MKFSLKTGFLFMSLVCLAVALTQATPLLSLLVVVLGFALTFPWTDPVRWRVTLVAVLCGVGLYAVIFYVVSFSISPPQTAVGKRISEHNTWMEVASSVRHQTSIPLGALCGWLAGTYIWQRNVLAERKASPPNRYWIYGGLMVATLGTVAAVDGTLQNMYTYGRLVVLNHDKQRYTSYPADAQRWFAVHWNEDYFAISVPLLILVGLLAAGGLAVWYGWQAKKRAVQDQVVDPLGGDP